MQREQIVSLAQDAAKNEYASTHANAAYARLLSFLINNQPPAFAVYPQNDQFTSAVELLRGLAAAVDELIFEIARDSALHGMSADHRAASRSIVSDAMHDSDLLYNVVHGFPEAA